MIQWGLIDYKVAKHILLLLRLRFRSIERILSTLFALLARCLRVCRVCGRFIGEVLASLTISCIQVKVG